MLNMCREAINTWPSSVTRVVAFSCPDWRPGAFDLYGCCHVGGKDEHLETVMRVHFINSKDTLMLVQMGYKCWETGWGGGGIIWICRLFHGPNLFFCMFLCYNKGYVKCTCSREFFCLSLMMGLLVMSFFPPFFKILTISFCVSVNKS